MMTYKEWMKLSDEEQRASDLEPDQVALCAADFYEDLANMLSPDMAGMTLHIGMVDIVLSMSHEKNVKKFKQASLSCMKNITMHKRVWHDRVIKKA